MRSQPLPFAEMIQTRMRERGLGLRELCRAVDLDPSFFSKVLAGKRNPPSEEDVLRRLAGALELDAANVIVSAGRIPSEWRRLWSDRNLFERMHRLATEGAVSWRSKELAPASPAPARAGDEESADALSAHVRKREGERLASKPLGDELL